MGTFAEHINHSRSNLAFLSNISENVDDCWDWQVTVCFYSALHMINAHIVKKTGANYLSHREVDNMLNPFNQMSVSRLDEATYTAYQMLYQLSRRSRYLLNDKGVKTTADLKPACLTYSKHLKKAVKHLETIIEYMVKIHNQNIPKTSVKCIDLKGADLKHFDVEG